MASIVASPTAHLNGQNHDRVDDIIDSPMPDYVDTNDQEAALESTEDQEATTPKADPPIRETLSPLAKVQMTTSDEPLLFNEPFVDPQELRDSAYSVKATGGFSWKITNFSILRSPEAPIKEYLSDPVQIGGSSWQLKLYPNGFGSHYLGIYLQCSDFVPNNSSDPAAPNMDAGNSPVAYVDPVLPLFGDHRIVKLGRVVAQFRITVYNVEDHRVHYSSSAICGDFSGRNTDRGFSRFGPRGVDELKSPQQEASQGEWTGWHGHGKMSISPNGQKRAILENDTLAFHVQLRVVEDPTGHLWDNHYPGASYSMHGLRGLRCDGATSLISAVASWLMLAPFRKIIYDIETPQVSERPRRKAMKLTEALQRILYQMRCPPGGATPDTVSLDSLKEAIEWHGCTLPNDDEHDAFRVWDLLRRLLEIEVSGTEHSASLNDLFDGGIRYRLSSVDKTSIQEGVSMLKMSKRCPKLLHIEIPRQYFDENGREWRVYDQYNEKILDINEELQLNGNTYLLYGFIGINSKSTCARFVPVMRPDGKRWYEFLFEDGDNRVKRLTDKKAVEEAKRQAYTAIYVREDVALIPCDIMKSSTSEISNSTEHQNASTHGDEPMVGAHKNTEIHNSNHGACHKCAALRSRTARFVIRGESEWSIPRFLMDERENQEIAWSSSSDSDLCNITPTNDGGETVSLSLFPSDCFKNFEGPGIIDVFDPKWKSSHPCVLETQVLTSATLGDIKKIAIDHFGIKNPTQGNQCRIWALDSAQRSALRREFVGNDGDKTILRSALKTAPEGCIWVHITEPSLDASDSNCTVMSTTITDTGLERNEISAPLNPTDDWNIAGLPDGVSEESRADEISTYILVKEFNHENQTLKGLGSLLMSPTEQIEKRIRTTFLCSSDVPLLFFVEEPREAHKIDGSGTLRTQNVFNAEIIIIQRVPEEWLRLDVHSSPLRQNSPGHYLSYWWDLKTFPDQFTPAQHLREENNFSMDGHYYAGQFANGAPHGQGRWINSSGDVYEGEFCRGYRHGKGIVVYHNGDIYEGEWQDDEMHGQGKMTTFSSRNIYQGGFQNGKRCGKGIAYLENAEEEYASSAKLCGVCYTNEADAFVGCKHICMCVTCAKHCKTCPVCRFEIGRVTKLEYTCLR